MNPISEARADVAEALRTIEGIAVYDYIPGSMNAPAAVVTPGNPYVMPGRVLGEFEVNLNIRLFAKRAENEVVTKALDELIVNVCEVLTGWGVDSVGSPGVDSESYGTPFLVTDLTIKTNYRKDLD